MVDAKRLPMRLSDARDNTLVANRPMRIIGQIATLVDSTVAQWLIYAQLRLVASVSANVSLSN